MFNTYWGDGFAEGGAYRLVGPQQMGGLLRAPLCGHTIDLKQAETMGDLGRLAGDGG